MIKIPGYAIGDEIYNGPSTLIYRARRERDDNPVIIKLLKKEYPTPLELHHFVHEYEILNSIGGSKGILKSYDILDYWNSKAIVMEDIGGESLENLIHRKGITLKSFLVIAIKLCETLETIHKNNIIHKDIKPQNILLNAQTGDIGIIDFSISTSLLKDNQENVEPGSLEGTLQYISPEQTGRMNRSIDYRTDYYSLGVTFYEMLTGMLPFDSKDPMEIVHSHIAKLPLPPNKLNAEIPGVVSDIVMKLMAKNAEDRYQSAWGLRDDLMTCYRDLTQEGVISNFEIGKTDISDKFQIPEKLYGREKELETILSSFDKAAAGEKKILFITGESGIGKTAIIHEVQKPIVEKRGFFISGKYDKFKRNIPYSAIIQAFQELVRQILTKDEEKQQQWKTRLLDAVGSNGRLITEIIPQIELVIGEQPPIQELAPQEAQNRFNFVFQNFIKVFVSEEHPLVLFLDDLQWMDRASLNLIQVLFAAPELSYFLFFGSYRNNDVDSTHPLFLALENLKSEGVIWENLNITHLNSSHINMLIRDTLHQDSNRVEELAELTMQKTGGNPFFVIEFLKKLNKDQMIIFDKQWKWDINRIKSSSITDNVIDLMADKIQMLPANTLEIIKLSACIGVKTYLNTLSIIYGKTETETIEDLTPAINEGMIVKIDDDARFVHDRVREAAYSLIDKDMAKKYHYNIGTTLLNHPLIRPVEERIFSVVNQLNLCKELLSDEERNKLIDLNMTAAKKAKSNTAWDAACVFFDNIDELVSEDSWSTDYERMLEYYTERAEAEYVLVHYEKADEYFEFVLRNALTNIDKVNAYNIKIRSLVNNNGYTEAIEIGIALIKRLRFRIKRPQNANLLLILFEFLKLNKLIKKNLHGLNSMKIEDLIKMHDDDNENHRKGIGVLSSIMVPVFFQYPETYFPYLCLWIAIFSLKNGLNTMSAIGFMGVALLNMLLPKKNIEVAHSFSLLAQRINEIQKYKDIFNDAYIMGVTGIFISYWKLPLAKTIELFKRVFEAGYSTGNYQWASYALNHMSHRYFIIGNDFKDAFNEIEKYSPFMIKMQQFETIPSFLMCKQAVWNLIDHEKETDDIALIGKYFDENNYNKNNPALSSICLFFKLYLSVIFGKYQESTQLLEMIDMGLKATQGFIQGIHLSFLFALILIKTGKTKKAAQSVIKIIKKMEENATNIPENFEHLSLILKSELCRIHGRTVEAITFYEKAIKFAKDNGYLIHAALANELLFEFYREHNLTMSSKYYLFEAKYLYEKCGAIVKVKQLDRLYADFLEETLINKNTHVDDNKAVAARITTKITPQGELNKNRGNILDLGTVLKANQALSSEIEMRSLLAKMIIILVENAGAQKGILIFPNGDELSIEAFYNLSEDKIEILTSISIFDSEILSSSIIRYVAKTKETIVLDNASNMGMYENDPYIKKNNVLSVLCTPVIRQTRLVGILYLENNVTVGTFNSNRIEMLNMLTTQAAISIENARLIENMKEKERLKQEMEIAERIQMSLCPPIIEHADFEIVAIMKPAEEVGGDYYDISFDINNDLWLAIGDVSGHGVTPGLIMMMAQTAFNFGLRTNQDLSPKRMVNEVNRILNINIRDRLHETHFMTMVFLKYCGNGKFLHSGSHLDIIVYRQKLKKCEIYKTKGIFIGIIPDINDALSDNEIQLESGDILVLYTDGIVEAQNNVMQLWDIERMMKTIEDNVENKKLKSLRDCIIESALKWCDNKQYDDMTLMLVKMK